MIIGQSISGGAATVAAATAPDLITGAVELAPGTGSQSFDLGGLVRVKRYRRPDQTTRSSQRPPG